MKRTILTFLRKILMLPPVERFWLRFTLGKYYGTYLTKLTPNPSDYKVGSKRRVNRMGVEYSLDISDIVDWFIYFGFREKSMEELFKLINKSKVFIDVGANMGLVSLGASSLLEGKGFIHAFEPDPINFERLQRNSQLNTFQNLKLNNKGLGDSEGKLMMEEVSSRNKGMNRIVPSVARADNQNYREVAVIKLDDYVRDSGITAIDLIKIDVEGYEQKVIMGADEILRDHMPTLFIELDDNNLKDQGGSARELIEQLNSYGYLIVNAETKAKVNAGDSFANCHYDIIASKA